MDNSFLRQLARRIITETGQEAGNATVVFPSKRACLFFEKAFIEECTAQGIAALVPRSEPLEEWVCRFTNLRQADSLTLAGLLYQAYKDTGQGVQEFDNFIPWAEILLEDFSEIDFQLADADRIFSQGLEETKVEATFSDFLNEDEKALIGSFWRSFSQSKLSESPGEFVKQWEAMPLIHTRLMALLQEQGIAYKGLVARDACQNLEHALPGLEQHYFAGFGGFYRSHLSMVERMVESGKASVVWDADSYYIDGPLPDGKLHEAGRFFRKYRISSKPLSPTLESIPSMIDMGYAERQVREFEAPNRLGMAKTLATLLDPGTGLNPSNTAIILCDDGLLIPVIQSLPLDIAGEVNVTSGIPITKSQLFGLMVDCANLFSHFARQDRKDVETSRLEPLLRHPYVSFSGGDRVQSFLRYIANSQVISIPVKEVAGLPGLAGKIFGLLGHGIPFRDFINNLFTALIPVVRDINDHWLLEELKAAIFKWNRLNDQVERNPTLAGIDVWQAYRKSLYGAGLNFGGEPLQGLQVMGLLESRCLDFEHVIVLGANEGLLPAGRKRPGFLPHHIRKLFGLFTREDEESLSAYYLMRLFHRAKTISLVYAGSEEKTELGEKSRYLKQLEFESPFNIGLVRPVGGTRLSSKAPISIKKTRPVMDRLMESVNWNGQAARKPLHPSSLIRYLKCPLSFYLTNIAGLREPDDIAKDVDHRHFGLLLHLIMEQLYKALFLKKDSPVVEETDREWLIQHIDMALRDAVRSTFDLNDVTERSGEGILSLAVLSAREYAQRLVELDLEYAPFQIVQLEGKASRPWEVPIQVNSQLLRIPLHGTMDRVDRKGQTFRVVDFKTGSVVTKFPSVSALFIREKPANTAALQIILYSLILKKSFNDSGYKVEPALVSVKDTSRPGYTYPDQSRLKVKTGYASYEDLDLDSVENEFTTSLVSLLEEIFDPNIDFTQTETRETCGSCSFNSLCHKDY